MGRITEGTISPGDEKILTVTDDHDRAIELVRTALGGHAPPVIVPSRLLGEGSAVIPRA